LEFLRSKNSERRKNGMEAVALGRHGGRLFLFLGFLQSKNSMPKNDRRSFLGSARDRRGAEQPRREAAGPEAKPEPRIARFFAAQPQKMRPTHAQYPAFSKAELPACTHSPMYGARVAPSKKQTITGPLTKPGLGHRIIKMSF
jgi:hypothetical protein